MVMRNKVSVLHWRYEDGETCPNPGSWFPSTPPPRGWYGRVYPDNRSLFAEWMEQHCPTADCDLRFNSGDPMFTVYIKDDREATLFQLKWL